jgi:hypothetical protein
VHNPPIMGESACAAINWHLSAHDRGDTIEFEADL